MSRTFSFVSNSWQTILDVQCLLELAMASQMLDNANTLSVLQGGNELIKIHFQS